MHPNHKYTLLDLPYLKDETTRTVALLLDAQEDLSHVQVLNNYLAVPSTELHRNWLPDPALDRCSVRDDLQIIETLGHTSDRLASYRLLQLSRLLGVAAVALRTV